MKAKYSGTIFAQLADETISDAKFIDAKGANEAFEYMCSLRAWDGRYLDKAPLDRTIKYMLTNCPEYGLMDGYVILGF